MEIDLRIYSPRWGHDDTYRITLEQDRLSIDMQARHCEANYRENLDPEWSGEPLFHIFRNDSIYAPEVFQRCLEWAWLEWRNGNISDDDIVGEMEQLAEWLNTTTRAKPNSDFWRIYF